MGIGKRVDGLAGAFSRILHLRGARENTVVDLDPYLDRTPADLFPAPPPMGDLRIARSALDRVMRSSTLTWTSGHEVLCPRYRVRHEGTYDRNLRAWARWIRPSRHQRTDCLVYVHGWLEPGPWAEESSLFRLWSRALDADIVHVTLPFHGCRTPRSALYSGEYFWTADLVRSLEGVRQAVCDVRTIVQWLRGEGYRRIGVTGLSLGGAITMLQACLEPTPDYIIPIISHLELEDAVEQAPILWRMKRDLNRWGIDKTARRELFRRIGLSKIRPRLAADRQLWVEAREDLYIGADLVAQQWQDWGQPPILWIGGGHMTFPVHIGRITARMADFIQDQASR